MSNTPRYEVYTLANGKFSIREVGIKGFMFDATKDHALMTEICRKLNAGEITYK